MEGNVIDIRFKRRTRFWNRAGQWVLVVALAASFTPVFWAPPAAAQSTPPPEKIAPRLIVIRPYGFEPAQVKVPAGLALLVVHNRSGVKEVSLRLDAETGNRLQEVRVPREVLNWRKVVPLTPGRYLLTEANHPQWMCNISVTPR